MRHRRAWMIVAAGVLTLGGSFRLVQSQEQPKAKDEAAKTQPEAKPQAKPKDDMMELYGTFVDAVEQVEANYVKSIPRKELIQSALRGMLADLDPYSAYYTEQEWEQFTSKFVEGRYTGIGVSISVDPRGGRLRILAPLPGSPAYAAGIKPGDVIVSIDGQSTSEMPIDKAFQAIQGRPGTQLTLEVMHPKAEKPSPITLTRAIIELPSVLGDSRTKDDHWDYMLDKTRKIGYVRITNFMANTGNEFRHALQELTAQGMAGLILDLRDDPGGPLAAAVEVSDLLLDSGKIVTTKGRNQADKVFAAKREGSFGGFPLVVLVNQNSASASEIVASALQDNKRGVVVGRRSFGKGSVQSTVELDNGKSLLKLTVASYWRPSGVNIHRFKDAKDSDSWGVSPDPGMEVKLTAEEEEARVDSRRERDLISRANPEKADKPSKPAPDRQLDKAIEVLKAKFTEALRNRAAE